jgi:hypothetical protein
MKFRRRELSARQTAAHERTNVAGVQGQVCNAVARQLLLRCGSPQATRLAALRPHHDVGTQTKTLPDASWFLDSSEHFCSDW